MLHQGFNVPDKVVQANFVRHSMKKLLLFIPAIALAVAVGIGFSGDLATRLVRHFFPPQPTVIVLPKTSNIVTSDVVWAMIGQVDQDRLLTDLRRLTGAEQICLDHGCYTVTDRETGSIGLQWVKDYVYEQLSALGYAVESQNWSAGGYTDQNLVARKIGFDNPAKEIYFVAHLDGVSGSPAADDNASGVVSLLELARILSTRTFHSTVVLLFTTGEEHGVLGAHYYVDQLTPEEIAAISYVVDVDMLSYDGNSDGVMELYNGSQPIDFVKLLGEIIAGYQIGLSPEIYPDCG